MAFSPINRIEQQETGSNPDTWGIALNRGLTRLDEMADGILNISLSGERSLNYSNGLDDEAHYGIINLSTGVGGQLNFSSTVPGQYFIRNGTSGSAVLQNGVGANTTVQSGSLAYVLVSPLVGVVQLGPDGQDFKAYVDDGVQSAKDYAEGLSFEAASAALPAQGGNAGKFITTDGSIASWQAIQTSNVSGLDQALQEATDFAIVASLIF